MNSSGQNAFQQTEQIISQASGQIASLKGLLKGKGEAEDSELLITHAKELRATIKRFMETLLFTINTPPYTYFGIQMRTQHSGENTYLRWVDHARTLMGVKVWENAMLNPPSASSDNVLEWITDMAQFERTRLILNRYMGYLYTLIKQHSEYLQNINHTDAFLQKARSCIQIKDKT